MKTRAWRSRACALPRRGASWRPLSPSRRQRDLDDEEAKASLEASRVARSQAAEEARGADRRREAGEERGRGLLDWCHSLEEQGELREAALASMKVASGDPAQLQKREEALT